MKETPIIFSTEMVRAILDGRKTQTRRVVKPQFSQIWGQGVPRIYPDNYCVHTNILIKGGWKWLKCPFGKKGDRLWVRETFAIVGFYEKPIYRADGIKSPVGGFYFKWKPSIHMPKKYARIWLEITNIRAERLKEISATDIRKEGVGCHYHDFHSGFCVGECGFLRGSFQMLWDSINGKKHPWSDNPWVWVIEFKQSSPPQLLTRGTDKVQKRG